MNPFIIVYDGKTLSVNKNADVEIVNNPNLFEGQTYDIYETSNKNLIGTIVLENLKEIVNDGSGRNC